jgi:hypothetical protein
VISLLAVVFCIGISAAGTSVAAEPLANDKDNPAAPNNGTAHARCFRFEACFSCDMVESSHVLQIDCMSGRYRTLVHMDRTSIK